MLGATEVFDFEVYNREGLVFKIDTVKENEIFRGDNLGWNILSISDAIVNTEIMQSVFGGVYDHMDFRIVANTTFVDLDGNTKKAFMQINTAKFHDYTFDTMSGNLASGTIQFKFPPKDSMRFNNLSVVVV